MTDPLAAARALFRAVRRESMPPAERVNLAFGCARRALIDRASDRFGIDVASLPDRPARTTLSAECALFGVIASSPLSMPWTRLELTPDMPASEVLLDSIDQIVDEDLHQLRDRGAIATSTAGDWRDEQPLDTWHQCDSEPPPP